jgi:predicted translin family RNA/ssDNA-binding protein
MMCPKQDFYVQKIIVRAGNSKIYFVGPAGAIINPVKEGLVSSLEKDNVSLTLKDSLEFVLHDLHNALGLFEDQRRNIGRAYAISGDTVLLTKKAIATLRRGDHDEADSMEKEIKRRFEMLLELNLPEDIKWQFSSEVGQEIVEFVFVKLLLPVLFEGKELEVIPDANDLKVTPQAYLAGLGDIPGELGKFVAEHFIKKSVPKKERREIRLRYLDIITQIYDVLDQFETVYPRVINATRRRGYNFRFSVLARVRGIVRAEEDRILEEG